MAKTAARSKSAKGTTRKSAKKGTTRKAAKGTTRTRAAAGSARSAAKSTPKRASSSNSKAKASRKLSKRTTKSAKPAGGARAASGKVTTPTTATTAKKPTRSKAATKTPKTTTRSRARRRKIDVKSGGLGGKVGSFGLGGKVGSGPGVGLLNGKPGSIAAPESEQDRPALTRTKLTARELRNFRELLLAKRRQLLNDLDAMENEALRSEQSNLSHLPVHMADMGTDNYEQEFTLDLVDRDRRLIDEIDHALEKIEARTYGICEGTGQMITKERLEAQPWARFSIEHARRLQRPGVRR